MLPTFVTIGAMKSGTTSLHNYLALHPEIGMSEEKEPHFFVAGKSWEKGLDWYRGLFPDRSARGESSPGYTRWPSESGVPARMQSVIPEAKLIYLLRDPVERVVSHYIDAYSFGRVHGSLADALGDMRDNHFVNCSRYHMQLRQYEGYFPRDRLFIITTEDLRDRRAETLRSVYRFLGVDESFESPETAMIHYTAQNKARKTRVGYVALRMQRAVGRTRLRRILPYSFASAVTRFNGATERPITRPELDAALRARLTTALADDVAALREDTGRDFAHWSL